MLSVRLCLKSTASDQLLTVSLVVVKEPVGKSSARLSQPQLAWRPIPLGCWRGR